jgi:hypothetical protein
MHFRAALALALTSNVFVFVASLWFLALHLPVRSHSSSMTAGVTKIHLALLTLPNNSALETK